MHESRAPRHRSARATGRPGSASALMCAAGAAALAAAARARAALSAARAARWLRDRRAIAAQQPRAVLSRARRGRSATRCCASTSAIWASACSSSRARGGARSRRCGARVRIEGLEHSSAARAGGRGVLVVSGHFTTLELCGRLMCDHVPLAGMYRPHAQPAMEWAVKRGRLRYAAAMFTERGGARRRCATSSRAACCGTRPTRTGAAGQRVRAVLRPAGGDSLTSTHQLARLSAARGGAVLPRAATARGYVLRLWPALPDFPSTDATADTARVMAAIEAMVRAAPSAVPVDPPPLQAPAGRGGRPTPEPAAKARRHAAASAGADALPSVCYSRASRLPAYSAASSSVSPPQNVE